MHRNQRSAGQSNDVTLINLPFLSASTRQKFSRTRQELHFERLATVRFQAFGPPTYYQNQLIIEVDSDDMEPRLCQGDWLRCHSVPPSDWPYLPAGVYVVAFANTIAIRRIKTNTLQHRQYLTIHSDNASHESPVDVPREQLRQIWRILEIVSGTIY